MAPNIRRLQIWLASTLLLLVVVVGGFFLYGRYRIRHALSTIPKKLGIEIQQSTEGFSLSKSEGGHTLFTIRASKAVQYKQGGMAELKDVNIVVYGRNSNRFDQIYGSDFEYDPKKGIVRAKGEVHIDLEGNAEGATAPDQSRPRELKNPIHLMTSGLVFDQKNGTANTDDRIEFRVPQVTGSATGASYDSHANTLTLHSKIEIASTANPPSTLQAAGGVITKDAKEQVVLNDALLTRGDDAVRAERLTLFLRPDNSVERILGEGKVTASGTGTDRLHATAAKASILVSSKNEAQSAELSGGVLLQSEGQHAIQAQSQRVVFDFTGKNQIQKLHAIGDVHLKQPASTTRDSQTVELTADATDLMLRNGKSLLSAETSGAARIVMTPAVPSASASAGPTTITATKFVAQFDQMNRLQSLVGSPNAKVVSSAAGQPDKTTTSNTLRVTMNPDGGLRNVVQEGDFRYLEPAPAGNNQGPREAWAAQASYNAGDENLALVGSPRIVDGGVTTTAERVSINRRTGEARAEGQVKTTYSELKPQPNGALLATADPIHVTAASMTARRSPGIARYAGGARLWQGSNIVEAPTLDFDRDKRSVDAVGSSDKRVSTVFVQQQKDGRVATINVTATRLTYIDSDRKVHFDGSVILNSSEGTMTADSVEVFLQAHGSTTSTSTAITAPSQLDRIVAQGHVNLLQPNRRATGQILTYTSSNGEFKLTGGSPSIFDAERGNVTGVSLTFYSHDDRVLVEGGSGTPSVTKARVIK